MPDDNSVVPATPLRAQAIAEVHVASSIAAYREILPPAALAAFTVESRAEQWRMRLIDPKPGVCTFVALDGTGAVGGFANGGPARSDKLQSDGELYAIYVHPEAQRKRLGTRLFAAVARALQKSGFGSLGVWVLALNPSRGFYESLGGEAIAEDFVTREGAVLQEVGYRWRRIDQLVEKLGRP